MVTVNGRKLFIIPILVLLLLFSDYSGFTPGAVFADDDISIPPIPSALTPSDGSTIPSTSTTYILQWTAVDGATTYRLEVNSSPTWDESTRFFYEEVGNVTSKEISDLPYNQATYYWRVWSGDSSGWSEPSESGNLTTPSWLESEAVDIVTNNQGKQLVRISVLGKPDGNTIHSTTSSNTGIISESTSDANILSDVPSFCWSYGSSPTAAAMLFGYYDRNGYPDMYTGPANNGVCPLNNETAWAFGECPLSATHQGYDELSTNGHVDDYYVAENSSEDPYWDSVQLWAPHTDADCTADFMGTSQYTKWSNLDGTTTFFFDDSGDQVVDETGYEPENRDGCHGMRLFAQSQGYSVTKNFNQLIYPNPLFTGTTHGFTFNDYKTEIDAGRPVLLHIGDYTVLGIGYAEPDTIFMHDTLDHDVHTITWGDTYLENQHYGVSVIELTPTNAPATVPTLSSPAEGTTVAGNSITFEWNVSSGAIAYRMQVKRASDMSLFYRVTVSDTTCTINGFPEDGEEYVWQVRAYNANGWSDYSPLQSFINTYNAAAIPTPPRVPTLSSPDDGALAAGNSITFRWDMSPGATKYRIQVKKASDGSLFSRVTLRRNSYTMKGFPEDNNEYVWQVRAFNANGWSDYSPLRSFTNTLNTSPPPPVPVLSSPDNGATVEGSSITFKWNASSGATKYRIQAKRASDDSLLSRVTVRSTSYTMKGFPEDNTEYLWQVRAFNANGWSDYSLPRSFTNPFNTSPPPPVPDLSTPVDNAIIHGSSILFEWNASPGALAYRIQVKKKSDLSLVSRAMVHGTSYTIHDFPEDGSEYIWQVRAYNANGWSDYSPLRSFTNTT